MRLCPICQIESDKMEYRFFMCPSCGLLFKDINFTAKDINYYLNNDKFLREFNKYTLHSKKMISYKSATAKQFKYMSGESWRYKDLLEINSGAGHFLFEAEIEFGARVHGIESIDFLAKYCQNSTYKNVINDSWETVLLEDYRWNDFFDIICSDRVLENMLYPLEAIRKISMALRYGGCWITSDLDTKANLPKAYTYDDNRYGLFQIFDNDNLKIVASKFGLERENFQLGTTGTSINVFRKLAQL